MNLKQILQDLLEVPMSKPEFESAMNYFGVTMQDYHNLYAEWTGDY